MSPAELNIIQVFLPAVFAFAAGLTFAPAWLDILIKNKMWKKKPKNLAVSGEVATVFQKLHGEKESAAPRMGGVVIWASTITVALLMWTLSQILPNQELLGNLDFISRSETWIPLFTLLFGGTIGLIDDLLEVRGSSVIGVEGLSLKKRLLLVSAMAAGCVWWFYEKLEISTIAIPFANSVDIGPFIILFFILVMIGTYSGGIIDGIDGLSGGVFTSIFGAYGLIAFLQDQFSIAALCFVISGSIMAFLWFNLPPAKYYMTETGTMSLTLTLAVIAFLTDKVLLLVIIAMPLAITPVLNIVQLLSKKYRGKKIFQITPIHHHFEAKGFPGYQIAMKYWIVSIICALSGVVIALLG